MQVAFAEGESFMGNFLRLLGDPSRIAEVHFLAVIDTHEEGRRKLAESARSAIQAAMTS
jgi:1-acyl-sn-glycerol-3-phosphate acyltransferase